MPHVINLLIDTDINFLKPTKTMLFSLIHNLSNDCSLHIYYSYFENQTDVRKILNELATKLRPFDKLFEVPVPSVLLNDISICSKWSKNVWLKLFSLYYLPPSINKILHIDGDVIIRKKIDDFYDYDINSNKVGVLGTLDYGFNFQYSKHLVNYFGIKDNIYINCGFILLNPYIFKDKFRTIDCLISFIKQVPFKLISQEQDIINYCMDSEKKAWENNKYMVFSWKKFSRKDFYNCKNPSVIHYAGPYKPWFCASNEISYKALFWRYGIFEYGFSYFIKLIFRKIKRRFTR